MTPARRGVVLAAGFALILAIVVTLRWPDADSAELAHGLHGEQELAVRSTHSDVWAAPASRLPAQLEQGGGREQESQATASTAPIAGKGGGQIALRLEFEDGRPVSQVAGRAFLSATAEYCPFRTDENGAVVWQHATVRRSPVPIERLYFELTSDGPMGSGPYDLLIVEVPATYPGTPFDAGTKLVVPRLEVVRGRVLLPSREPAVEAEVLLYEREVGGTWRVCAYGDSGLPGWTLTKVDGSFTMYGVCDGREYRVDASLPGFVKTSVSGLECPGDPVEVVLNAGSILRGGALVDSGVPAELIHVQVVSDGGGGVARTALNEEGRFALASIFPGRATVTYTLGLSGPQLAVSDELDLTANAEHSSEVVDLRAHVFAWTLWISDEGGGVIRAPVVFRSSGERKLAIRWAADRASATLATAEPGPVDVVLVSDPFRRLPLTLKPFERDVAVVLERK